MVTQDYRRNILIDRDSPLLAAKALPDRYDERYGALAGVPYLASPNLEDALMGQAQMSMIIRPTAPGCQ